MLVILALSIYRVFIDIVFYYNSHLREEVR
jgi:hypothetical protein